MGRFLFVTWWGGGNVTPVRVLGSELVEAGHDVRVLGPERLRSSFEELGLELVAQAGGFTATPEEVTAEVDRAAADAAIVDFMLPEAMAAVEAAGGRWAPLVHTLAQPVLDDVAPTTCAFVSLDAVNARRRAFGLPAAGRPADLLGGATRILAAGPEAIDRRHERAAQPAPLRHLGALLEPPGRDAAWTPPPSGRPLVVVCLGTTPMDEAPVLQRVIDAAAGLEVDVLATVGEHIDPSSLRIHGNTTVSGYVRHAAVLPHASLVVTHAGLGTVTSALTFGLPTLCLPLGRDQHDNAARVVELGAGRAMSIDANAGAIAHAMGELVGAGPCRAASQSIAARIREESAPGRAMRELVELAGA
jgi:UDP:flavonoid glycosyltransferase YjiC (YdhE family)